MNAARFATLSKLLHKVQTLGFFRIYWSALILALHTYIVFNCFMRLSPSMRPADFLTMLCIVLPMTATNLAQAFTYFFTIHRSDDDAIYSGLWRLILATAPVIGVGCSFDWFVTQYELGKAGLTAESMRLVVAAIEGIAGFALPVISTFSFGVNNAEKIQSGSADGTKTD